MIDTILTYFAKLFTERCDNVPLLDIGEDSVRYDFFIALSKVMNLKNYEISLESAIGGDAYIPRDVSPRTMRGQKPKMDMIVNKLNLCIEFGLFRQDSNEDGTINKTDRLIKTLNDMIRLGIVSKLTGRNAYFICVADSKMLGHQLQSKLLGKFPDDYIITSDLVDELKLMKTTKFDSRFTDKMKELKLSLSSELIFNKNIEAEKIKLETRLLVWQVKTI